MADEVAAAERVEMSKIRRATQVAARILYFLEEEGEMVLPPSPVDYEKLLTSVRDLIRAEMN